MIARLHKSNRNVLGPGQHTGQLHYCGLEVHLHVHVNIHVCAWTHGLAMLYASLHVLTLSYAHTHICVCMYVCMYACISVYIHTDTCTHVLKANAHGLKLRSIPTTSSCRLEGETTDGRCFTRTKIHPLGELHSAAEGEHFKTRKTELLRIREAAAKGQEERT